MPLPPILVAEQEGQLEAHHPVFHLFFHHQLRQQLTEQVLQGLLELFHQEHLSLQDILQSFHPHIGVELLQKVELQDLEDHRENEDHLWVEVRHPSQVSGQWQVAHSELDSQYHNPIPSQTDP